MSSDINGYDIKKILDVVMAFNSETCYEKLLNIILTKMIEITYSDAGTLYIAEEGKLHFRIMKNISLNISRSVQDTIDLPPIVLNKDSIENISAYAAIHNEIIMVDDVYESKRFNFSGPKHYDKLTGYRTRSMLVLPLATYWSEEAEVLGVIQLINAIHPESKEVIPFDDIYQPPVIPALSHIAAQTLANLTHMKETRLLFRSFAEAMTDVIDERSSYNSNHTKNIVRFCDAFAQYLGELFPPGHIYHFDENRLEGLSIAALLHDIGKISAPLHIMDKKDRLGDRIFPLRYRFEIKKHQLENDMLKGHITESEYNTNCAAISEALKYIEYMNTADFATDEAILEVQRLGEIKYRGFEGDNRAILEPDDIESLSVRKGTLTNSERAVMQQHATVTGRLLGGMIFWKYNKNIPDWAGNHHEFLDGSGYPRGLKGDELAIETCIITITDIFEALIAADRPYKKAFTIDKALAILVEMAEEGKLHRELVKLFIESRVWEKI